MMKKTILNNIHVSLGAKMAEFAGYEMPIQYSGVKIEHLAVRNSVGVFDVSHMGEFIVKGPNALPLLQKICSNDIAKIKIGKAQYNCFPNEIGGIIDDLIIYRIEDDEYFLVLNASNIEKDWNWINKWNAKFKAEITNISDETSLLAIQGPNAMKVVQSLSSKNLSLLEYYSHVTTNFAGKKNILISTTGYTGSGGVEVYCKNEDVIEVWESVFKAGKLFGIVPVGLAARDTLRIEMGYCLYGNEIDDKTSPIMAGLGWITKPLSGCLNGNQFEKEKLIGTKKKLIGIKLLEKGIPRSGYKIFNYENIEIGYITSGTHSPSLTLGIGLGYIKTKYSQIDTTVFIEIRNKKMKAVVVKVPFLE
tara:strand:+ start:561 stop:1646 length:1086 start_codon:yes stop_codon:yes gene_type:complete